MKLPVALIVGAGDATGSALARRFAKGGFHACVVRRSESALQGLVDSIASEGRIATAFGCDARKEEQVVELFAKIEKDVGPIEVVIHNIGANIKFDVVETTVRKYSKVWEMVALSSFLVGREAAKTMVPRGKGTILFTGATASTRGGAGFSAFAGGMHAKRALAQSLAREIGPKGVHVGHVVIDGPIHTKFVKEIIGDDAFHQLEQRDALLKPDAIAESFYQMHLQPRVAWTHEMDLRPWVEKW